MHDKLGMEAYKHIVPCIDPAIAEYDSVRLLFDLTEYYGRESGAVLEDAELSVPHWADVERVVVTETIPLPEEKAKHPKITVLKVANLLGEAIARIHSNSSVSSLFV